MKSLIQLEARKINEVLIDDAITKWVKSSFYVESDKIR